MKTTLKHAAAYITTYVQARVVPNLIGSPGIGKSDVIKQVAENLNLKLIDFRLSTCDPTDLTGLPFVNNGRSAYLPNEAFPLVGDELPKRFDKDGSPVMVASYDAFNQPILDANKQPVMVQATYAGWLLFLDEITNAPMAVQAAAYKLVLDRQVGLHDLHPKVEIACAGNSVDDNAAVQAEMSTALKSRMAHINIETSLKVWDEWACGAGVHHSITSFLKFKPEAFYKFDPKAKADTFPCPRTWGMVDKVVQTVGMQHPMLNDLLSGVISDGYAHEYISFTKHFTNLPVYADIVKNPSTETMPDNQSVLYALSGSIGAQATATDLPALITYLGRMPAEFQLRTFNDIMFRNPTFVGLPAAKAWLTANAKKMTA